ncbi:MULTISPECIES: chemotaxis protein [Sporomusaceae]|uniref:chemotaxis protein n=1 Tax=Sporomusaceae TaxID=1843490 RepID=UPI0003758327|nr:MULTISPECIES: chemotaxis protein [Sporomusaceae]
MEQGTDKKGILLESGTNEFEIVEFVVGEVTYGINVAKVREVINLVPVTKMPNVHPYVDGVFTLRGRVMPLVNLPRCLGQGTDKEPTNIIVSELNEFYVGFLVHGVSRIHRISWSAMEEPPAISSSEMVVGIVKMAEKMVLLLDFEKIVSEINPEINQKLTSIPTANERLTALRKTKRVLVAEDSPLLRDLLVGTLHEAGYEEVIVCHNGQQAWERLEAIAKSGEDMNNYVNIVITDIEMPKMDGHHLLKRIREESRLAGLPVFIFSSLINEEMRRKGENLGADGQISKPEIVQLIDLIDKKIL